ncbi:MAG: hypothetical protein KGH87_06870 [Thaumarchaeota archaeon]|nr:hypothetical protein [Nitrososphaerota archaeon]
MKYGAKLQIITNILILDPSCIKNDQQVQYIYKLKSRTNSMSTKAWKCYRCNLTFADESHAALHEDLSKHNVREIQIVKV